MRSVAGSDWADGGGSEVGSAYADSRLGWRKKIPPSLHCQLFFGSGLHGSKFRHLSRPKFLP